MLIQIYVSIGKR